jgi:hypothetical protein
MRNFLIPAFIFAFCLVCSPVFTSQGGPPTGVAGDPPFNETCAANGCHTGSPLNSGGATTSVTVLDSALNSVSSYIPKKVYTIIYSITEGTKTRYGFESCVFKSTNLSTGTLAAIDASKTRVLGGSKKYAQHTSLGTDFSTGTATWQMRWTAPNTNEGNATIYTAFNATNRDGNTTGDKIYTRTLVLTGTGGSGIAVNSNVLKICFQYGSSMLSIQGAKGNEIKIYSLDGKCVMVNRAAEDQYVFSTLSLEPGIYIVSVKGISSESLYKFVKP